LPWSKMQLPDAATNSLLTVQGALAAATRTLRLAGIEDAGNDARRLLCSALGVSAAQLLASPEMPIGAELAQAFEGYVARRAGREPVSRILGERDFYGRTFTVSPATLEPRPDSETLIEVALGLVNRAAQRTAPLRILDIGTGSGCLLATLLCELPN